MEVKKQEYPKDIEAEITFLSSEESGRKNPFFSGYRPQFFYDGQHWDAIHHYIGVNEVYPGQTVTAYLSFMSPEFHVGKLHQGKEFLICEGQRVIGKGHIIKVIDLETSAEKAKEKQIKQHHAN